MDTILIVEDSQSMQCAMERIFCAESFHVELASDGIGGLNAFRSRRPSAVVVDLKLPGMHGRDLCRELKATAPEVPVIVVSANSAVNDKILLLELGADDYVTKPFSPKELVARVRRAIRRAQQAALAHSSNANVYRFSNVTINYDSMEVSRGDEDVTLTPQEYRLLKYFVERPGRIISREKLLDDVWKQQNIFLTRTVDNHVLHLRQKLESDPENPQHFLTMHGSGYQFTPEPFAIESTR